ncbi:galactose mutarotase (plasmid) [Qingshengfaniella alkalisoli]|uniref:Galactose mutarotase n=2 Tax=Qingshengfaniella alkalisoli TaxID=2599296 RepID=A0A5B8IZA2_9RHOB|nr:galactose mutarotase [Qingshengfaniella alkalisoli]
MSPGVYEFGSDQDGNRVDRVVLSNGELTVAMLTRGAILQDVRLKDVPYSLTLGANDLAPYLDGMAYFGALVGPVVNRISGAKAELSGQSYSFDPNQDRRITLHSGKASTSAKIWTIAERSETEVEFTLKLSDGDGGFPGNRDVRARFALDGTRLSMTVSATTDKTTWVNFANHSYWNMDGTPSYAGHTLRIAADRYCVADDDAMVTGELRDVEGTGFDLRDGRALSPGDDPHYDTNFCLADGKRAVTPIARLTGTSGISMDMASTEPGLQVYDAKRQAPGKAKNHAGEEYGPYCGLAMEAQCWPDAPNKPDFPSIVLREGERYEQVTTYTFSR